MTQPGREEDRIREALGLPHGALPRVEGRWLRKYFEHLSTALAFPFPAQYTGRDAHSRPRQVIVLTLLNPESTAKVETEGLFCIADDGEKRTELPLQDIVVDPDHPNGQMLEDYWYWFWNWSFDPQI